MAVEDNPEEATKKLQTFIDQTITWTKRWRVKLNENKSVHINYTIKKDNYMLNRINNVKIPYDKTAITWACPWT